MAVMGIDVSEFQNSINWKAVKESGVEFAIIRAGFGQSKAQKDKMFESHINGALAQGIKVGAYWFGYAYTVDGAKREAEVCAEVLKPWKEKLSLPVFYDWEYDSVRYAKQHGVNPSAKLVTDMTLAFMGRLKELGFDAGYYTNSDFFSRLYDYNRLKSYPLWYAYYANREPDKPCVVQQYTSEARVPGIPGNVDGNWLRANISKEPAKEPEKVPEKKPSKAEKTYTVKAGDTLSGIAKKYGTTYQALTAYNGIANPNLIYTGQKIKIPVEVTESEKMYTVQPGDTLSGIAKKYGTTYQVLAKLNGISNPDLIYGGQVLKLP